MKMKTAGDPRGSIDQTVTDLKADIANIIPPEATVERMDVGDGTYVVILDARGLAAEANALRTTITQRLDLARRPFTETLFRRANDDRSYTISEAKLTTHIRNF